MMRSDMRVRRWEQIPGPSSHTDSEDSAGAVFREKINQNLLHKSQGFRILVIYKIFQT